MRRFLPTPIDEAMVWRILNAAARAPSGFNMQPWLVHVVSGDTRARLSAAARAAAQAGEVSLEYSYLPDPIEEPYRARRRKLGYDLYALQGIEKHDRCAREAAMLRNYDFFGAPVGLFFHDGSLHERWRLARLRHVYAERDDTCAELRLGNVFATSVVRPGGGRAPRTGHP